MRGDQRKRKPTREDFQRFQRLMALLNATVNALCGRDGIGYFLPVKYLDRLNRVTNGFGAGAIGSVIKSKLDNLACDASSMGAWVFYPDVGSESESLAKETIRRMLESTVETLPAEFMPVRALALVQPEK